MPKLKTVKGVKERIHVTGTGKLIASRPGRRHLLAHRRAKTKRQLRNAQVLASVDARKIRVLLPYE